MHLFNYEEAYVNPPIDAILIITNKEWWVMMDLNHRPID